MDDMWTPNCRYRARRTTMALTVPFPLLMASWKIILDPLVVWRIPTVRYRGLAKKFTKPYSM
jgi:hypothetical protein